MCKVVQCIPLKTMSALAVLEDFGNAAIRRERVFRDREDLLVHDGDWLISRFRFPRVILLELCAELWPVLKRNTEANQLGLCQSPVNPEPSHASRYAADIRISARYIKFPYNVVEQANIKAQFAARAGFPTVIGAIDYTHIAIKAPSHDEFVYVNR